MRILDLKLENFRGIKNLEVDFRGKDTDIYGANGLGKTTIANAICWLLIDRPATDEKEFDPKTVGEHGLHHKATIKIEADDGQEISYSKDFYEKYTKKRGSATAEYTGNAVDYYIDGVKVRQKEYLAAVESACGIPLEKARMLLILSCFTDAMKTDEKRKILFELAGEFTDEDVLKENGELADLKEFLLKPGTTDKYYSIDQWKQIASDRRKKLNKDLELLPARIDEVKKSIPETVPDIEELQEKVKQLEASKGALEEEKRSLGTKDGKKEALRAAIAGLNAGIEEKRAAYIRQGTEANAEINAAIDTLTTELRAMNDDIYAKDKRLEQTRDRIRSMGEKRKALMNEYAATRQETWDPGQEICPTCGQKLPAEKVQELRAAFNQRKSEKLENINQRGQAECSQSMIAAAEKEAADLETQLKEIREKYSEAQQRLQNLKSTVISQPPFESTKEYLEISKRIEELRAKEAQEDSGTSEAEIALAAKIDETNRAISDAMEQIAVARRAKESQGRMDELEKELKGTAEALEHLEHGIQLCEEFIRTKARMVTDSINRHFSRVRFILFRDQINGGLKEVCEPTGENADGQWVEYRSLNFASKVNAQLDIINTFNKHYGTNLPVIMDQAESVTEPMEIDEQLIRLIVSAEDKDFRIVVRD